MGNASTKGFFCNDEEVGRKRVPLSKSPSSIEKIGRRSLDEKRESNPLNTSFNHAKEIGIKAYFL
jgi:hypothetical protein